MGHILSVTRQPMRMFIAAFMLALPASLQASVIYTYDGVGRIATALYDNNECVTYSYDANGNRTSQIVLASGDPNSPIWGTGILGCFRWSS